MRPRLTPIILSIFFILIFNSCKDEISTPPLVDDSNNGFETREVALIFAKNCATSGCHAGSSPVHGLSFESWDKLMKGSIGRPLDTDTSGHGGHKINHEGSHYGGNAVIPYYPDLSLAYRMIIGNLAQTHFKMPYQKNELTTEEKNTIKTWIQNGAKNNKGEVFLESSSAPVIYVCSQAADKVYLIDSEKMLVKSVIDVDFNPTFIDAPHHVQVYHNYVYISLISAGKFIKYDKISKQIVGEVNGLTYPGMIAISQDGTKGYVSKSSTASGTYNEIYVINLETMQRETDILLPVSGLPHGTAYSSGRNKLYVANLSKDRITTINTITNEVEGNDIVLSSETSPIHEPMHIYVSKDDNYLFVSNRKSYTIMVFDLNNNELATTIDLESHPMYIALAPNGEKIYAVMMHSPKIAIIAKVGTEWQRTGTIEGLEEFHMLYGAVFEPSGKYLFVTCSNQLNSFVPRYRPQTGSQFALLCVIDTEINQIVKMLDVGSYATGITTDNSVVIIDKPYGK